MIHMATPRSWLFVKGHQSIRVVRTEGRSLIVQGPDAERQQQDFVDEETLQSYQVAMAERLADRGWVLYGVDRDRRVSERRSVKRQTSDRRAESR